MTAEGQVVLDCVGPYRFFGESVVKACLSTKTHYLDISGEPQFIESMQLKYHQEALEVFTSFSLSLSVNFLFLFHLSCCANVCLISRSLLLLFLTPHLLVDNRKKSSLSLHVLSIAFQQILEPSSPPASTKTLPLQKNLVSITLLFLLLPSFFLFFLFLTFLSSHIHPSFSHFSSACTWYSLFWNREFSHYSNWITGNGWSLRHL
jgi:hypothetical protein